MSEIDAYHEAGHALMAVKSGGKVLQVTIEPQWDDGPERFADIQVQWPTQIVQSERFAETIVCVALAGPVAEMIYGGTPFHPGFVGQWASDWQIAWEAAEERFPNERQRLQFLEQASATLHALLFRDDCWAAIAAIADELLAHETIDGEQVEQVVATWMG